MVPTWVLGANGQAGRSVQSATNRVHKIAGGSVRMEARDVLSRERMWRLARGAFLLAAVLLLFSGLSFMRSFADESVPQPATIEEKVVLADAGDSLWSIAERVKRDGLDTREAIYRIKERNGLASSSLRSGDKLIIPANVLPS